MATVSANAAPQRTEGSVFKSLVTIPKLGKANGKASPKASHLLIANDSDVIPV